MLDIWALAAVVTKFLLYLGVLTSAGTVLAALIFGLERWRGLALCFGVLGLGAAVLGFLLRGAALTGDASGMSDPEMLGLLWSTPVGTALAYRVGGLGMLVLGLLLGGLGRWVSAFGAGLALWSFDHIGHVPDRDTVLLDIALVLHLTAVALWIGILTPLKRLTGDVASHAGAGDLGHRFGRVALIFVPALVIAGGYIGYALVGSFGALIGTGYGQALLIKVVLVAGLLGLGAANKLRFVPGLRAGDPGAARHLSNSITAEWLIILLILAVTAVLTSTLTVPT